MYHYYSFITYGMHLGCMCDSDVKAVHTSRGAVYLVIDLFYCATYHFLFIIASFVTKGLYI